MVYINPGMIKTQHPALLPSGLSDLLPPHADQEAQAIHTLMHVFSQFHYSRVKPPLIEFEDGLLAPGPGAALSDQTFRLMDPLSQRMMGLRADTTAQIARIADSRLVQEQRPLRLSYAADVLRIKGSQIRPARQFVQVGCEMIGAKTPHGDAEVALIALVALSKIGVTDLTIDLTIPMLVPHILEHFAVSQDDVEAIEEALSRRDRDALAQINSEAGHALTHILESSGSADSCLEALYNLNLPGQAGQDVTDLKAAYDNLKDGLSAYELNVQVTIDPVEHRGLDYETGISFTLYTQSVRGEIGGGGRYSLSGDARDESATGFTLYMDSVLEALPAYEEAKAKSFDTNASWADIKAAQEQGLRTYKKS